MERDGDGYFGLMGRLAEPPTHWMPLPLPPGSDPPAPAPPTCICADGEIALFDTPDPCCPASTHNMKPAPAPEIARLHALMHDPHAVYAWMLRGDMDASILRRAEQAEATVVQLRENQQCADERQAALTAELLAAEADVTRLTGILEQIQQLPRYQQHDVEQRPSMTEYLNAETVDELLSSLQRTEG